MPWWHRARKRLRYWTPPSSQSLLVKLALRNPRPWRTGSEGKGIYFASTDFYSKCRPFHRTCMPKENASHFTPPFPGYKPAIWKKKSCPPQFLESFLKLPVTLNCLLVSVSNSKSLKADISITHNNDDSSCKSE